MAPSADLSAEGVGTTPAYAPLNSLAMASGAFLTEDQVRSDAQIVVLGSTLAGALFGRGEAIGHTVRVKGQPLRVTGLLAPKNGSGFGSVDDRAFVPIGTAQRRLFGARTPDGNDFPVSSIALSAVRSEDIGAIQSRVSGVLRERHRLKADGSGDDFQVIDQSSILGTLTTITTLFTAFLAAVAGVSLVVGGTGIMNIMLVSVTERTREIGLRKAAGAGGPDILNGYDVWQVIDSVEGRPYDGGEQRRIGRKIDT